MEANDRTRILGDRNSSGLSASARNTLLAVYDGLKEKGYDPVRQIAHYLLTGEPTYITAHKSARSYAQRLERDEVVAELLRFYLQHVLQQQQRSGA